jgi:nucleoside 2-deoxyribosyltransferase
MVCGSVGYGGISDIRGLYSFLSIKGFDVLNHIMQEGMDYSDIRDFRYRKELSNKIIEHDLKYVKQADVIVVIAKNPSYGTAIEVFIAKNSGKRVILLAKEPVPTPWPVNFSDYIATTEDELVKILTEMEKK